MIEAGAIHPLSASVLNQLVLSSINQVAAEHFTRSAGGDITDRAEGNVALIGSSLYLGNDSTNVLDLLVELMGKVVAALNAISTLTVISSSPGLPSSVPVNVGAFSSVLTNIQDIKSKLNSITG